MSINTRQKYISKDREVVETVEVFTHYTERDYFRCVLFKDKENTLHVLTQDDFLEQYKPHEVVCEYKFAVKTICSNEEGFVWEMTRHYYTVKEAPENINAEYKVLGFTKRVRKCQ